MALEAGFGDEGPVLGKFADNEPGERGRTGRCRGKVDGQDPGDLQSARGRQRLAGDRRFGEEGGKADCCLRRLPAVDVERAVVRDEKTIALRRVVPFGRRRNVHAGAGS